MLAALLARPRGPFPPPTVDFTAGWRLRKALEVFDRPPPLERGPQHAPVGAGGTLGGAPLPYTGGGVQSGAGGGAGASKRGDAVVGYAHEAGVQDVAALLALFLDM